MAVPSSNAIIEAKNSQELNERIATIGAVLGYSQSEIEAKKIRILTRTISDDGATISSVYEYAANTYNPTPKPGANPAAVTDGYIEKAIQKALDASGSAA